MNNARDETAEARPMNTKGKEKKRNLSPKVREKQPKAREYYRDSEGKEPTTKAGKG